MKLKNLLPSLREKKRYVLFRVISEEKIEVHQLKEAFFSNMLNMFGETGVAQIKARFLDKLWDPERQIGILRVNHKEKFKVIVALGLILRIGESRVNVKIYKISGTLKSLMEKFKDRKELKN